MFNSTKLQILLLQKKQSSQTDSLETYNTVLTALPFPELSP